MLEAQTEQWIVYSGQSRALVNQLVADFEEQTGIHIEVRYGDDADLLAVLGEEDEQSPADL